MSQQGPERPPPDYNQLFPAHYAVIAILIVVLGCCIFWLTGQGPG